MSRFSKSSNWKSSLHALETNKDHDRVEEIPSEFPFKIEDSPGPCTELLTREYQDELIKVEAYTPNVENVYYYFSRHNNPDTIPIIINVSKNDGLSLEFYCSASHDTISINGLSAKSLENSSENSTDRNADFSRIGDDENLRTAFNRYLESRGINTSFIGFLTEYMRNKDTREHLIWLKKMKNFIETMKPSADESVLRVLDSEIKSALETNKDHDHVEESTPSEFPFKIEDNPGQYTVILTREYRGELIKVEAHMSTSMEDDHCHYPIKMVINISMNDRPSLEFTCSGSLCAVSILELKVKNSENLSEDSSIKNSAKSENSEDDQMPFEGPNFSDLDEKLKKAFHRYLDAKGINTGFIGFLYEYMRNKCTREHLIWLKKMKNFIEV
ncbi:hypothetical protein Dsin_003398 [Dipteronia sinensis]|uniref:Mitochondrial glycoprotein n=1 Tax=Dipteronia sinensis TaxID=43782 RepID=A0AAE0EKW8_9ROSI|nr:hypothetical protein Dsin_003398 [Dipteronia sinensis]